MHILSQEKKSSKEVPRMWPRVPGCNYPTACHYLADLITQSRIFLTKLGTTGVLPKPQKGMKSSASNDVDRSKVSTSAGLFRSWSWRCQFIYGGIYMIYPKYTNILALAWVLATWM